MRGVCLVVAGVAMIGFGDIMWGQLVAGFALLGAGVFGGSGK